MKAQRKQCQTPNAKKGNPLQSEKLQRQTKMQIGLHTVERLSTLVWAIWRQIICFEKMIIFQMQWIGFLGWNKGWSTRHMAAWAGLSVNTKMRLDCSCETQTPEGKNNMTKLPTLDLKGCHWTIWWNRVGKDTGFRLLAYRLIWVASPSRTQTPLAFGPV